MKFHNNFAVDCDPDTVWEILTDIPRVAPCMPGAELNEVLDKNACRGNVKVRMGPVWLRFAGTVTFEERNPEKHEAVIKASGRDEKGRGGAKATIRFHVIGVGLSASRVDIETDMSLSGSVAQYGRSAGVVQAIASSFIDEFARTLERQVSATYPSVHESQVETSKPESTKYIGEEAQFQAQAQALSVFTLLRRALWSILRNLIRRRTN